MPRPEAALSFSERREAEFGANSHAAMEEDGYQSAKEMSIEEKLPPGQSKEDLLVRFTDPDKPDAALRAANEEGVDDGQYVRFTDPDDADGFDAIDEDEDQFDETESETG